MSDLPPPVTGDPAASSLFSPPHPDPPPEERKPRRAGTWRPGLWILVGVAATLAVVAVVGLIAYLFVDDAIDDRAALSDGVSDDGVDFSLSTDGSDDVGPCKMVDTDTVMFEVTNLGSDNANYFVDVIFRDRDGTRVRDETFIMDYLRAGESAAEPFEIFGADAAVSCSVSAVERFDHASPIDVAQGSCDVTGVDFADDLMLQVGVENALDDTTTYLADVVIVRDGVRVGSSFADIISVTSGEMAMDQAVTIVDGPVEGAVCDVVNLRVTG